MARSTPARNESTFRQPSNVASLAAGRQYEVSSQQSRSVQAHAYKFQVADALPQIHEAPETFARHDCLPHATGLISNQALQPSTNIWHPAGFDSAFGPFDQISIQQGGYHMTPLIDSVSSAKEPTSPVYNNPVPRPLYNTAPTSTLHPPTVQARDPEPQMIAFTGTSSPVSPISLNNDDKSSVVLPLVRRSSDAGYPNASGRSPPMSDLQSEQDRSYRLPRILPPKREGEPPKNADGKLICSADAHCGHLTFERKCEWR